MAVITHTEAITSASTRDECMRVAQLALQEVGAKPKAIGDEGVMGDVGSFLVTRILGGVFVSPGTLPAQILVHVEDDGTTRTIAIEARDRIGPGTRAGMAKKYKQRLQYLAEAVKSQCLLRLEPARG